MAKKPTQNSAALFGKIYNDLVAEATSANWDPSNEAARFLSQISINHGYLDLGIEAGISTEDLGSVITKTGPASMAMLLSDSDSYSRYFKATDALMQAIFEEDEQLALKISSDPLSLAPVVESSAPEVLTEPAPISEPPPKIRTVVNDTETTLYGREIGLELKQLLTRARTGDAEAIQDTMIKRFDLMAEGIPNQPALEAISLTYADIMLANERGELAVDEIYVMAMKEQISDTTYVDPQAGVVIDTTGAGDISAYIGALADTGEITLYAPTVVAPPLAPQFLASAEKGLIIPSPDVAPVILSTPNLGSAPTQEETPKADMSPPPPPAPLLIANTDAPPVANTTTPPPAPDIVLAATEKTPEVTAEKSPIMAVPESMDYEIQDGDMLSKIVAEHYGLTKWADIQRVYETVARNNGIENPDLIYAGNKLVLFDDPAVDLFGKDKPSRDVTAASKFNPAAEGIIAKSPAAQKVMDDAAALAEKLYPQGSSIATPAMAPA